MRLILSGTGAAGGVPLYGCNCSACALARATLDSRRNPCCAVLEAGNQRLLIDAGLMDLAERFPAGSLDGVLLTHYHPDHVQGLFHLRWGTGKPIDVYGPPDSEGCADLYKNPGLLNFHRLAQFVALALGELCAKMEKAGKTGDTEALAVLLPMFKQELTSVEGFLDRGIATC